MLEYVWKYVKLPKEGEKDTCKYSPPPKKKKKAMDNEYIQ